MRTGDGGIIQRCLNGEAEAFGFLVDKYRESVYAFAYARLRNFQDAEDVAQEVFITAYQKLGALRRWDNFFAWLYSITSNLCKNWKRSQSRRPDREFLADQDPEILDAHSIDAYQEGLTYQPLHDALEALPEMQRQVLTLYYLAGMDTREIAEFLGTAPDTVRQRLSRARSQLKEEMLAMMSTTFATHKLQPGFTLRVVERVKDTKIQPAPNKTPLPLGLSIATGLVAIFLSLAVPTSPLYLIGKWIGSPLPSQTQVAEVGVFPVDTIEVTKITILSSDKGEGDFGQKPKPDNPVKAFGAGKWRKKENAPMPMGWGASSTVGEEIYVIGGWDGRKTISTVRVYNPVINKWTEKLDMPTERSILSACLVNGKIYAIGGVGAKGAAAFATVEQYDPATDTWTKKADMPTARAGFWTTVVDGKIYAIGGAPRHARLPPDPLSTVEMYDPVIDKWTRKADMPTVRSNLTISAVGGKIYAIGGFNGNMPLAATEIYDPAADMWAKGANMPIPRGLHSAGIVDGKIYIIGGTLDGRTMTSRVDRYDPATDTWTQEMNMPTARAMLTTGMVNGKIYAIGGTQDGGNPSSNVEEFDPKDLSVNSAGKLTTVWARLKAGD